MNVCNCILPEHDPKACEKCPVKDLENFDKYNIYYQNDKYSDFFYST